MARIMVAHHSESVVAQSDRGERAPQWGQRLG